ncbi:MAG TPA: hypothetical protein VHE99_09400 [Gammaproteobacteria bacterium]|nr:hypothetical protein [Gammaproteobacteria bacterium]
MKKIIISFALSSVVCIAYGEVIPLVNINNCTDIADKSEPPTVCTTYIFAANNRIVKQGDIFNITCTFGSGLNNPDSLIPGDVQAMFVSPVEITNDTSMHPNEWNPLHTQGLSSATFTWTGKTTENISGIEFGINFIAPDNLRKNPPQTVKISCTNTK